MPGMDGTGPLGQGAFTGRGMGPCRNQIQPQNNQTGENANNAGFGFGRRRGFGRGCCQGMRRGRGAGFRGGFRNGFSNN
ncbi:MAG: DUF5320 domain-containing protein [Lentisphaerae bacterium]|nr:DUF5320 domain-containing protein [Lentisphaerota bacterium]MCP4101785.1 DUF5320 domain-containing protein [Lentisphaerota bacterium]